MLGIGLISFLEPVEGGLSSAKTPLATRWSLTTPALHLVLGLGFCLRLPLHVGRVVGAAAGQRDDMVLNVPWSPMRIACAPHEVMLCRRGTFDAAAMVASRAVSRSVGTDRPMRARGVDARLMGLTAARLEVRTLDEYQQKRQERGK